jgi:hypothetical protein
LTDNPAKITDKSKHKSITMDSATRQLLKQYGKEQM